MDFFLLDKESFTLSLNQQEILLIPEFKNIIQADKSKGKQHAFKLFTYLYLVYDWQSPFASYEEEEKINESFVVTGLEKEDVEIDLVKLAIDKYKDIQEHDLTIVMINSMKQSIHEYKKYFTNINFTEKIESGAKKGSLLFSVNEYNNAMKNGDQIFETIQKLEDKLKAKKQEGKTNTRGNTEEAAIIY